MKLKYRNVLFDLYGTLIDLHTNESKASLWRSLAGIYSMQGAVYTAAELRSAYRRLCRIEQQRLLPVIRKRYDSVDISADDVEIDLGAVFLRMYEERGVYPNDQLVAFTAAAFRSISMSYITLFPGVLDMLKELRDRGHGIYLVSNAQVLFTKPEMISLGLHDKFDGILYSSDAGLKKPSVHIFQKAIKNHALDPADCVMVGNDYVADVLGAHGCGLATIYVLTGQEGVAVQSGHLPDDCVKIHKITQVLDLVS